LHLKTIGQREIIEDKFIGNNDLFNGGGLSKKYNLKGGMESEDDIFFFFFK
jgi:hypothetical protein